jgi:hypothetical protein
MQIAQDFIGILFATESPVLEKGVVGHQRRDEDGTHQVGLNL